MKKTLIITISIILTALLLLNGCSKSDTSKEGYDESYSEVLYKTSDSTSVESSTTSKAESADTASVEIVTSGDGSSEMSTSEESVINYSLKDKPKSMPEPQSGQLTAGEWSDNENFEFFNELLNNNEWYNMKARWGFLDFQRVEVRVVAGNESVQNAVVKILNNKDQVLYESKTDNEGKAYLFPYLFTNNNQTEDLKIQIIYNDKYTTTNNLQIEQNNISDNLITIELLNQDIKKSNKVDIMFVVDTTGSMSDELEYLKKELEDVVNSVQKENANNLNIRVSTNFYRDVQDEYLIKSYPFENNIPTVINQIKEESADGGGDYEEAVEVALNDAIFEHEWNKNARARILFLVLDAPPHHNEKTLETLEAVSIEASKQGIKIIPIASSGVDKDTEFLLRFLDVATGGTYVFLTDDSGIGNSHIEPTIGFYQIEHLNNLLIRVINENIK